MKEKKNSTNKDAVIRPISELVNGGKLNIIPNKKGMSGFEVKINTKTKKQQGKMYRVRGHNWEREVAKNVFRKFFPKSKRGLQYQDHSACDVEGTPFRIECSVGKSTIRSKWNQVKQEAENFGDVRECLVFKKWEREEPVVTMSLTQFKWFMLNSFGIRE